jgi:hypothetical protein
MFRIYSCLKMVSMSGLLLTFYRKRNNLYWFKY